MGNIIQINIKNHTCYFFKDMINIKDFDLSLIEIDKKSYKNIDIYNVDYITITKLMIMKILQTGNFYLNIWISTPALVPQHLNVKDTE